MELLIYIFINSFSENVGKFGKIVLNFRKIRGTEVQHCYILYIHTSCQKFSLVGPNLSEKNLIHKKIASMALSFRLITRRVYFNVREIQKFMSSLFADSLPQQFAWQNQLAHDTVLRLKFNTVFQIPLDGLITLNFLISSVADKKKSRVLKSISQHINCPD